MRGISGPVWIILSTAAMLVAAAPLQAPVGPAPVRKLQRPGEAQHPDQGGKSPVIRQVRPQLDKTRHAPPPASVCVKYMKATHRLFRGQRMQAKALRFASDVHPANTPGCVDAPVVFDLPPAQRTAAIVKSNRLGAAIGSNRSHRWCNC